MKKILSLALIICLSIILIGCGNSNAAALSKNIDSNVNRLSKIISKVDEANINDLQISEFSTIAKNNKSVNDSFILKDSKTGKEYVKTRSSNTSTKNNLKNVKTNTGRKTSTQLSLNNYSNQKYKARHVNMNDVDFTTNQSYNNYLNKVENLYVMVNDVTCANEKNIELKTDILNCCKILKDMTKQLRKKGTTVTDSQVKSCNDLLETLKLYTNKISLGRNEITNECKNVNNVKFNLTASIDQVTSKYLKLLNAMDTRLTFYENALSTLKQIINCLDSSKLSNLEKYLNYDCENGQCENQSNEQNKTNKVNQNKNTQKNINSNNPTINQNIDSYKTPTINPNIINRRNTNYNDNYNNRNGYIVNKPNQYYPYNNNYNYNYRNPYNGIPTVPNINTDTYRFQTAGVNNISNQTRINNNDNNNLKNTTYSTNNNYNTPIYSTSKDIDESVVLYNPNINTGANLNSNPLKNTKNFNIPKQINGTNIEQKNVTVDENYRTLELEKKEFNENSSKKINYKAS